MSSFWVNSVGQYELVLHVGVLGGYSGGDEYENWSSYYGGAMRNLIITTGS